MPRHQAFGSGLCQREEGHALRAGLALLTPSRAAGRGLVPWQRNPPCAASRTFSPCPCGAAARRDKTASGGRSFGPVFCYPSRDITIPNQKGRGWIAWGAFRKALRANCEACPATAINGATRDGSATRWQPVGTLAAAHWRLRRRTGRRSRQGTNCDGEAAS